MYSNTTSSVLTPFDLRLLLKSSTHHKKAADLTRETGNQVETSPKEATRLSKKFFFFLFAHLVPGIVSEVAKETPINRVILIVNVSLTVTCVLGREEEWTDPASGQTIKRLNNNNNIENIC